MNYELLVPCLFAVPVFLLLKFAASFIAAIGIGAEFDYDAEGNKEKLALLGWVIDAICLLLTVYVILDWRGT